MPLPSLVAARALWCPSLQGWTHVEIAEAAWASGDMVLFCCAVACAASCARECGCPALAAGVAAWRDRLPEPRQPVA
jgi:hypothetical protein